MLVLDSWNDFGFRTQFSLWRESNGKLNQLGALKILKIGQQATEKPLPSGEVAGGRLPDDFGSLGNDLDYYLELQTLPQDQRLELLHALRDLPSEPARLARFADEEGLKTSLLRDHPKAQDFYEDTQAVLAQGVVPVPRQMSFAYRPDGAIDPIRFNFRSPSAQYIRGEPSRRMVALVGENGVGKTRLLAALARLAYAPPGERHTLEHDGVFEGEPAFPSVVAVSYSAFDDFEPPRLEGDDIGEVVANLRDGGGRYAYCGMRDLATLIETGNAKFHDPGELNRLLAARLKQIETMGRWRLLADVLAPLFKESSFLRQIGDRAPIDEDDLMNDQDVLRLQSFLGDDPARAVAVFSSGHKIVFHLLTSMTASLKRHGLALIDEPELHLHPPLLAALMTGIRILLDRQNAYAIVATHSPVIAQETLASQVMILEPGGVVRSPEMETLGENTGALTREIFGLHTEVVDYRRALQALVSKLGSIEAIEAHLCASLSPPALAYVSSRLKAAE